MDLEVGAVGLETEAAEVAAGKAEKVLPVGMEVKADEEGLLGD